MFFSIKNNYDNKTDIKSLESEIYKEAKSRILFFPFGPNEVLMEKYLQDNYKISLRDTCLFLLRHINFTSDSTNTVILNFLNPKYDKLAQLITYGPGTLLGSKILKFAFDQFGGN